MKKVLVIEDNDDIREGTVEVLTLAGYEALSAKNGKLGVEMALSTSPDIILCDIMMPELDGYGVLYLLSKNPKLASIPFIFMTAKAERADMRKGMEMGADDYLTKPFDDLELFNAIESRLKKKSQTVGFKAAPKDLQTIFAELKQRGKSRSFASKQVIYVENDEPAYLYFIKSGQVKTYKRFKDGRELSSNIYKDGDFFGYESLCCGVSYADNAATLMDSELLLIPKADFMDALFNHQEMATAFIDNNLFMHSFIKVLDPPCHQQRRCGGGLRSFGLGQVHPHQNRKRFGACATRQYPCRWRVAHGRGHRFAQTAFARGHGVSKF